jgi:hypothetical protein
MPGWFERLQKRRRELAEEAEADLVQFNRHRFRVACGLIGPSFHTGFIDVKFRLSTALEIALRVGTGVSAIVGIVLAKWAQQEQYFLTRPDPEGPAEIFKKTPD